MKGHTCRTILSRIFIFAKGQINEERFLRNVESWQSLSLADTSDLVSRRFFGCWCRLLTASSPVITRNQVACSSSEQEWAEDWTNFAMLKEQTFALVQCLASLANWWGIGSASQELSITSTEERAHVPSHCWKLTKPEFGRHLRPCVGKSFSCWCCCVKASRNPVATRNHVAEHWTFAMLKERTLALRP